MKRITPAAEVASSFRAVDEGEEGHFEEVADTLKAITVRLPIVRHTWLQLLAMRSGRSRNEMANELLRVGISAVLAEMEPEVRSQIERDFEAFEQHFPLPPAKVQAYADTNGVPPKGEL